MMRFTVILTMVVLCLGFIAGCGGGGGEGGILTLPTNTPNIVVVTATPAVTNTPGGNTPIPTNTPGGPTSTPTTDPNTAPTSTPTSTTGTPTATPTSTPTSTTPTVTPTVAGAGIVKMVSYVMQSGDQVATSGTTVSLIPASGSTLIGTTGTDGSYTFNSVPVGVYTLKFEKNGYNTIQYSRTIVTGNQTWTCVFNAPF